MFELATKEKCKLRLAIMGVSGAGKTYSALKIAQGIGSKIAFIDTERRAARKYSDRFKFQVCDLEEATIDKLIAAIEFVNKHDFDVLIIDSLTHAWQELLEEIDKLTKTKYAGNSFRAWSEGTPKQKKLINAILECKCHVIATMRAKTEYVITQNDKGKATPQRVGTGAEQGKGIEYEFDMLIDISQEHIAHVLKDRTGKFQDSLIDKPDSEFGKQLLEWLEDAPAAEQEALIDTPQVQRFIITAKENSWSEEAQKELLAKYGYTSRKLIKLKDYQELLNIVSQPFGKE